MCDRPGPPRHGSERDAAEQRIDRDLAGRGGVRPGAGGRVGEIADVDLSTVTPATKKLASAP